MSLTAPKMKKIVIKQFQFKLKSCSGMFSTLVILQLIALLFSLGGSGMSGGSRTALIYEINFYSIDIVVIFTTLWAFINAILIKTRAYREDDFAFVTNRVSSNLANIVFLLAASTVGGITAFLSGYLLRVAVYFLNDDSSALILSGTDYGIRVYAVGLAGIILYLFLFSSLGYLIGTLVHLYKLLAYIIPVVAIGFIFFVEMQTETHLIREVSQFYFDEESIWLFCLKAIMTSGLLFTASMSISNRLEVR